MLLLNTGISYVIITSPRRRSLEFSCMRLPIIELSLLLARLDVLFLTSLRVTEPVNRFLSLPVRIVG